MVTGYLQAVKAVQNDHLNTIINITKSNDNIVCHGKRTLALLISSVTGNVGQDFSPNIEKTFKDVKIVCSFCNISQMKQCICNWIVKIIGQSIDYYVIIVVQFIKHYMFIYH